MFTSTFFFSFSRNMVVKPENFVYECLSYNNVTISLIENDLEKLLKSSNENSSADAITSPNIENGKYQALKLRMTLPSSCYATSALRELLKGDSSFKTQEELNKNSMKIIVFLLYHTVIPQQPGSCGRPYLKKFEEATIIPILLQKRVFRGSQTTVMKC